MSEIIDINKTASSSLPGKDQMKLLQIEKNIRKNITCIKAKVYDIGRLLSRAKKILPHGQFQPWIEETFRDELPYSTAALYKSIYDFFQDKPRVVEYVPVSILLLMKQKEFPEEMLKIIEADPEGFSKDVDAKTFKKEYADHKNGKKSIYDIWADSGKDANLIFDLLRNRRLAEQFDRNQKALQLGFSRIDTGIGFIRQFLQYPSPPALVDHYNTEFDKRIDMLQKAKAAYNDMNRPDRKVSNL